MSADNKDIKEITQLIDRLCIKLTGQRNDVDNTATQQKVLTILGRHPPTSHEIDEVQIAEQIIHRLARDGRMEDAVRFRELHRVLQSQTIIKKLESVLSLLHLLSKKQTSKRDGFFHLPNAFSTSTPLAASNPGYHQRIPREPPLTNASSQLSNITTSRGFLHSSSSGISSALSSIPSKDQRSHSTRSRDLPSQKTSSISYGFTPSDQNIRIPEKLGQLTKTNKGLPQTLPVPVRVPPVMNSPNVITEEDLIRELIYVFQGIQSTIIKFDRATKTFTVDDEIRIENGMRNQVFRLSQIGWLYKKIENYVKTRSMNKAFGLVGQSFCVALNQQLFEFFRLVAVLEAKLKQADDPACDVIPALTLDRVSTCMIEPLHNLRTFAALVDVCKDKKGGMLLSVVNSYLQHGNPNMRAIIRHTLIIISQPIFITILHWIQDGEMDDPFLEFFVACDPTVKEGRLWNDKYHLRKMMIPSFISHQQASRILLIGKSINFLRQVCRDRTPIKSSLNGLTPDQGAESMFTQDDNNIFQTMIDSAYSATSAHLLQILIDKYKFMDHLKAMRRYLLLGQGDFLRHLMDLLQEDLAKTATEVYVHNLTGYLEMSIRATNAQFDSPDILKRLDVRLLEVSPGDIGWDVFSLDYKVDGPISTVFPPECIIAYLRVFNFLWRAKRMEYILSFVWKQQLQLSRTIRRYPALSGLLHHCHIIASKMIHFVQQFQYYINFEVLECSWHELLTRVSEAIDLDHIIAAHQVFLDTIISRCLLDEQSQGILTKLRAIFDLTIDFQLAQEQFNQTLSRETEKREHFESMKQNRADRGEWDIIVNEEEVEISRRQEFISSTLTSTRPQLQVLATSYQDMVKEFLQMLTVHEDASLRFLSFRLDFNKYYNVKDPKSKRTSIRQSLT